MKRRNFIGLSALTAGAGLSSMTSLANGQQAAADGAMPGAHGAPAASHSRGIPGAHPADPSGLPAPANDRAFWADTLYKIASPLLRNMSKGELRKNMPVEYSPSWDGRDKSVAYMEGFGRLMAGLAPWLSLPDDSTAEGHQRQQLKQQALQSMVNSVDPANPDYLQWNKEAQPLVDAAYIAQTFLRAPAALWEPLDNSTKQRFIKEFKGLRRIKPAYNNWLLFAATIEAFLLSVGEQYDPMRIEVAVHKVDEWYVGDGWYSDGPDFHFDYYNGFVMHPMLVDTLNVLQQKDPKEKPAYDLAVRRMQRYGEVLERLISPEGSYPAFGRSITYRVGAFQPLAQLALNDQLPEIITPGQVRCALTAVMQRMFTAPGVFTADGWLQLGFAGHQPGIADYYSNSGSMYLTSLGFLPLGLPAAHTFWTAPFTDWTARKAWSGQPFLRDHAVDY